VSRCRAVSAALGGLCPCAAEGPPPGCSVGIRAWGLGRMAEPAARRSAMSSPCQPEPAARHYTVICLCCLLSANWPAALTSARLYQTQSICLSKLRSTVAPEGVPPRTPGLSIDWPRTQPRQGLTNRPEIQIPILEYGFKSTESNPEPNPK